MAQRIKLQNLPWFMSAKCINEFFRTEFKLVPERTTVLYDTKLGLSRGNAVLDLPANKAESLLLLARIKVHGREVRVSKNPKWLAEKAGQNIQYQRRGNLIGYES